MKFTIPIIPTPKRTGKIAKRGKHATLVPEEKQQQYVADLLSMLAFHEKRPKGKLKGPLALAVWAYMPIPQSKSDWWKEAAAAGIVFPTTKPDMSNLTKQIEDCMKAAGYIEDDSQIVDTLPGGKRYSDSPRWEIEINEVWQPSSKKEYQEYLRLKKEGVAYA